MSDENIREIRDEFSTLTGDYFKSNSPEFAEYTRAIIAARDAQWREMLGEPVAWQTFDGEGGYEYRAYEENEGYAEDWAKRNPRHAGWVSPLYAIKDKP